MQKQSIFLLVYLINSQMKNRILFLLVSPLFFLQGCKKENMGDCFKSTGKIVTEQRVIAAFNAIDLYDNIDLNYHYSTKYKLEVTAGENLQEQIKTKIEDGVLIIENDNKCNWVRSYKKKITVNLYAPTFTDFTFYGSGEIVFRDTLKNNTFKLNLWNASGNLYLKLKCDYIELKSHTGPGFIQATGDCRGLVTYLNGIGVLDAANLISQDALVINRKTGRMIVNCQQKMQAEIEGRGNIEYYGNPIIELKDSGSGELIHRE